jgi:dihydrofolate reductase
MPNTTPVPKYKKGDRVIQRTSHTKFASLLTGSEMYKTIGQRKVKIHGPKTGVLTSDAKRDKPQRGGRRHFYYHVKWDVSPEHENTVQQGTIKLEESP